GLGVNRVETIFSMNRQLAGGQLGERKKGRSAPSLAVDRPSHGQLPCRTTLPSRQVKDPSCEGRPSGNLPCIPNGLRESIRLWMISPSIVVIDFWLVLAAGEYHHATHFTWLRRELSAHAERRVFPAFNRLLQLALKGRVRLQAFDPSWGE